MLLKKRSSCKFLNADRSFKSFLFTFPTIVLSIVLITYLMENKHSHQQKNKKSKLYKKLSEIDIFKFPLVKEFKLSSRIRKFDNEDARTIGFPVKENENVKSSIAKTIYLATTYFSEWNPKHYYFLHFGNKTFTRYPCAINNCHATNNPSDIQKADAVLFHVRDLEVYNIPQYRSPNQTWILYSMEPPWLEVKDMKRFNGIFNWTMSYRRESDILLKYGFIGRPQHRSSKNLTWRTSFRYKRNKAVWYVSNCKTDSNREEYVARLMKVYPVKVIGGCGTNGCRPAETEKCYNEIAEHYKFYLAFENAICRDYVTEKLFNPLDYGIIPVALGGADYSRIVPRNSVINAMEFSSPEDLGEYLWTVSRNETLYFSYFSWKNSYRSYLQPWMCDLCKKLHDVRLTKTCYDLESWWDEGGSCKRWNKEGFIPVEKHIFPQYHVKLFD